MVHFQCSLVLLSVTALGFLTVNMGENVKNLSQRNRTITKTSHCSVVLRNHHNTTVKCKITDVCQLKTLMADKTNVTHLDLSHNGLQTIPGKLFSRFPTIKLLSIAFNNISALSYEAFSGLHNLTTLNLSGNPLRSFSGSLLNSFASLRTVDATGILNWKPEKQMLQLPMLQNITGLSWSTSCYDCHFYRTNVTWSPYTPYFIYYNFCKIFHLLINPSSKSAQLLNNTSFNYVCKESTRHPYFKDINCKIDYLYLVLSHKINQCWPTVLLSFNCTGVLAALGVVVNLFVVLTVMSSERLRNNVSMLFVCNLAVSDFLVELFTVYMLFHLNSAPYRILSSENHLEKSCPKIGFLWMLGQSSTVTTSLLLTVERYLVIVYVMNPNIRISCRTAKILIGLSWLMASILTGYAFYYNLYSTLLCVPISFAGKRKANFTMTVIIISFVIYLSIFILYIHIYLNVKRTTNNGGPPGFHQESKLAKRIAIVVFTNVILFVLPLVLSTMAASFSPFSDVVNEIFKNSVPVLFLCANSCLNPIMYAFRLPNFRLALKQNLFCSRQRMNSVQDTSG